MSWELRNLGVGERAARRDASARVQQAKFAKIQVMDQVAREVAEAHAQVRNRSERITITQRAIQMAEDSYQRNLSRIRDGQGLPLEALQSLQALEDAAPGLFESGCRTQSGTIPIAMVPGMARHRAFGPVGS